MRLACLHLPGFVLQVHALRRRALVGTAFAVLRDDGGKSRIAACSRAARDAGVRSGMTPAQARAACGEVALIDPDPAAYDEVMRAIGEAALGLSSTVDITRMGNVVCVIPARIDREPFAERLIGAAERIGLVGRVGIASTRFTAWAATQARPRARVRGIPRGQEAAFLAPLSIDLLSLGEEIRSTLKMLGVKTLGDFAELPPPSVGRQWARWSTYARACARGEDEAPLEPYVPATTAPSEATIRLHDGPQLELGLVAANDQTCAADRPAIDVAIARLRAQFGESAVIGADRGGSHRLDAICVRPSQAIRVVDPPATIETESDEVDAGSSTVPRMLRVDGTIHRVTHASGPTRLEGEWWTDEPLARDYYEVETEDGGRYWLYRDRTDGKLYLHGVLD